jgi:hypothetical protein
LGESLNLWDELNNDKTNIEAKFSPLYEQFAILEKYEVPIPEEVNDAEYLECFRKDVMSDINLSVLVPAKSHP